MKLRGLFILFLCTIAQVHGQWREDFSLVPFYDHAPWQGDLACWTHEQGWLKSQGPAVSGTCIRLERAVAPGSDFELRFLAHLMLATSSNNYLEVELEDSLNQSSIVIVLGGTLDEVSVYYRRLSGDSMLINGTDKRLASSSSNLMAVRLRRMGDSISLDLGLQADTSSWIPEGTGTLKTMQAHVLRIRACYSASNAGKFLLDAIYFGVPDHDSVAPVLLSVYDSDSIKWELQWSEAMDTNLGSIMDADGDTVPALWKSGTELSCFVKGTVSLPLALSGFQDMAGNRISDTNLNLLFVPYVFREIQITEVFPDPSPPQELPEAEWIELFNAGSESRQLKDFMIADLSGSHLFPQYILTPGERLILSSPGNCATLTAYGNCQELDFSATFLNNAGDRILLQNRQGDTLEWLEYSDDWHADALKKTGGYSLEKKDPSNGCLPDAENFKTSSSLEGGSPGQLNSIDARISDSIAPYLVSFALIGPARIDLEINEPVDITKAKFLFQKDSLPFKQLAPSLYRVELPAPLPDDARLRYAANLIGLKDCSGNRKDQSIEFRYAIPLIPAAHELIFTEVLFKPNTGQAMFIELYNRSEMAQSLAGTSLICEKKEVYLSNKLLYPGEVLILCKAADTAHFSGLPYLTVSALPTLNSASGHLALKNIRGDLLDAFHYSDTHFQSWPQKAMGYSLQRLDSTRICSYPGDWEASMQYGGEPGMHVFKGIYSEEIVPKLQEIYPESKSHFYLRFSAPLSPEQPDIGILDAWGSPISWDLPGNDFRGFLLEWSDSLLPGIPYRLEISGAIGCNGEKMPKQELEFRLSEKPFVLRINEVLVDPIGDDPDYVELYNAGTEAIDLKGMKLCNLNSDGSLNEQFPITAQGYLLMPGSFVVLTEARHHLSLLYGNYEENRVVVMDALPSFPNSEGTVVVIDSVGNVLDSFRYSDKFHNPILTKTEGVSLERIDVTISALAGNNWTSASADVSFGTPGRKNSQCRETSLPDTKYWNLYSPTFSPDGDGFEDLALLVYSALDPGSLVSINVHSLSGIRVKEWTNNLPCGSSGSLKWEGMDDLGQILADGPYVVCIEWTNSSGISKKERLVLVKASPLND